MKEINFYFINKKTFKYIKLKNIRLLIYIYFFIKILNKFNKVCIIKYDYLLFILRINYINTKKYDYFYLMTIDFVFFIPNRFINIVFDSALIQINDNLLN